MSPVAIILVIYLAAMIGIGVYSKRRVSSTEDYHLAGRRLGPIMIAGTLAATEIGGGSSVGVAAKAHGDWGLSAGWYVVSAGIGILLVTLIAPALRRSMATTVPEILARRYGKGSQTVTSVVSVVSLTALTAVQITATATIASVLGGVEMRTAIVITGIGTIIYTWLGGMWSVTLTDFVQFFLIVFGFAIAVPFALNAAGGWASVAERLPEGQLGFTKIGWPTIVGLVVLYFMTFSTGQEAVQRYFSAKSVKAAVLGSLLCGVFMSVYAFIPAIIGLIAKAEYPDIVSNNALVQVSVGLLPPLLAGLLLSAVISATLSSASGDMLGAATVYVKDIHGTFIGKPDDKRELQLSRLVIIVVGVIATAIALLSQAIIPLLVFAFTIRSTGPFAAFIFALAWRKTSRLAGLLSVIVGTVVGFVWEFTGQPFGVMSVIAGSVAGVVVFLVVHLIDKQRGRLVGDAEPPIEAPQPEPALQY
ncbi:sodium:solute symporter [Micromonospora sp. NPDC048830]|uniref:sodium:solute symporter family protein n=1 Tax=Micromonospora sp. NPDC048830 TaxID=3364257 RepID=UPI00371B23D1